MHTTTGSLLAFGEALCVCNNMLKEINPNLTSLRARAEGINVLEAVA